MKRLFGFLSSWQNLVGFLIVLLFTLVALMAPLLSPPNDQTQGAFKKVGRSNDFTPHPPGENAILGTLPGQTDVFHALVWGTRDAMIFGLSVALGAFLFGSLFGAIAGYASGAIHNFMMRIADAFLTFPVLAGVVFLQEIVATTIESMGGMYWFNNDYVGRQIYFEFTPPPAIAFLLKVDPILISLIILSWMPFARLVSTIVLTLKNTEFVQAARTIGGSPLWIVRKHLLPNSIGPAIVLAARDVGSAVILQATINFIGLGGDSPAPWGTMLSIGRDWIIGSNGDLFTYWWTYLPATLMIMIFGIAWNLLGDGINNALDPKSLTQFNSLSRMRRKKDTKPGIEESMPIPTDTKKRGPDPVLTIARDYLDRGDFESAIHAYRHLINRSRELDNVILDLARLVKQYPDEPSFWQTLGDALANSGEIKDAVRAYEQAGKIAQ
jgi:peptide/nickel transport system permease protein